MTALDAAVQPLWLPRQRIISRYKYTCPKCGREHGKRSLLELWRAKLRLAMGANGEADIDSGDGAGKFLINDDGKLKICGLCCGCNLDGVQVVFSGVDASICSGCVDHYRIFQTLILDGTYDLPYIDTYQLDRFHPFWPNKWYCVYGTVVNVGSTIFSEDVYAGGYNCDTFDKTNNYSSISLGTSLFLDDDRIYQVGASAYPLQPSQVTMFYHRRFLYDPYITYGDSISQSWSCGWSGFWTASDGGSAVVTRL